MCVSVPCNLCSVFFVPNWKVNEIKVVTRQFLLTLLLDWHSSLVCYVEAYIVVYVLVQTLSLVTIPINIIMK